MTMTTQPIDAMDAPLGDIAMFVAQHRASVLAAGGEIRESDRALWAACGLESPALRLVRDEPDEGPMDEWFDARQDWDGFWSRKA